MNTCGSNSEHQLANHKMHHLPPLVGVVSFSSTRKGFQNKAYLTIFTFWQLENMCQDVVILIQTGGTHEARRNDTMCRESEKQFGSVFVQAS